MRARAALPDPPAPRGGWLAPALATHGRGRISIGGGTSASLRSGRSAPEYRYRNKSGSEPAVAPRGRAIGSSIRESRHARK
ncbi:hypothetical protein L493_0837 [Bordetella bronchiseptica 99-R-0433]|nr:hypothetical protein L493_0837 [Bordetella bronchiseptica 99-R-0433]